MGDRRAAASGRGVERAAAAGRPTPRAMAGTALRAVLLCGAVFLTGAFGVGLPHFGARLALPLLPSGIAVAGLTRWGRQLWPAVFLAEFAIDLVNGVPPLRALVVACGLPAGAWLIAWLLERRGFNHDFARARDVPLFLGAAAIGMLLPATIGMLGFVVNAPGSISVELIDWFRWWSNTVAGTVLIGPLLIALRRESLAPVAQRPLESTICLLALIAISVAFVVLPSPAMQSSARAPLYVASMMLLVFVAVRLGLVVSSAAALLLVAVACYAFAFDLGIFRGIPVLAGLVTLWSFVVSCGGLVLIVTALLAERDAAASERLRAERRYAQVFEASPQPLWVYDPATLDFLLVNEATERQYGYSREELVTMRVSDLAAPGEERPVPAGDAAPHGVGEPFETRHRTRDGRPLEIEMWTRPIDFGGRAAMLAFAADATERKALGRALIDAIAGEQRRIGQEMHDGLGQELTGLSLSMRALATRANREQLSVAADLDQLAALINACIQSARRIVHGLSPLSGADGNLVMALSNLAEASSLGGLKVHVHTRLEAPLTLPLEARNHLFRIAQEALQNAQKHAAARTIDIELAVRPDAVRLSIADDGTGTSAGALSGSGLGMRTMRYRAASIGGRLSIRPQSPSGTIVTCEAPQPQSWGARIA